MACNSAAGRKKGALLLVLVVALALLQVFIVGITEVRAEPSCTVGDDLNGNYQKSCTMQCDSSVLGYTVDVSFYGNNWYQYINGYGAVDIGSGPVRLTLQCANGSVSISARLDYDTGDYGIDFGWTPIPVSSPPALTLNPVTTPTRLSSQTISGTREAAASVLVTCPTAIVSQATYPTDTTWTAAVSNMQQGDNVITVTATNQSGGVSTVNATIHADLPVVSCSPSDDNNGDYQKSCTVLCEPADWGYTVDIGFYGNNWYQYINGYGAVDIGSGPVNLPLQCVNGSASASARLDYDTGDYGITFGNWVPIPVSAPPALTLNPLITPTRSPGQTISGTREAGASVSVTCPTATVSQVTYPTDTTWTTTVSNMQQGNNLITVTATKTGNVSTLSGTIQFNLPVVSCNEYDDNGDYQKSCTAQCEPSDWGYTVSVSFYGNNWYQYINGYGAVDIGSGPVTLSVQCVNGSASVSARLDYDTGSYGIDFGWVPVPR